MDQVQSAKVDFYIAKFDKELSKLPIAVEIETVGRTKVPKTYIFGGIIALLSIFVFFNIFGALITALLGFLWPAYQSFKAIEAQNKALNTQWLTYWTNIIEVFSDTLLYWVPFYYAFKAIFVLYLIAPQFHGAQVIYNKVLEPYLLKEQSIIDGDISKV
ncbi:ER membrane protein DP1/Yop1 [Physocladia obscura]|uniref:Protein YOP1 n=1 Tax=Physocladia obscura TaxID=109957 RepID=A0AAD5XIM5_9FUNG|nr:ER membrane protein DP1/Yop1 [Physocladia obscura]